MLRFCVEFGWSFDSFFILIGLTCFCKKLPWIFFNLRKIMYFIIIFMYVCLFLQKNAHYKYNCSLIFDNFIKIWINFPSFQLWFGSFFRGVEGEGRTGSCRVEGSLQEELLDLDQVQHNLCRNLSWRGGGGFSTGHLMNSLFYRWANPKFIVTMVLRKIFQIPYYSTV